MHAIGDVLTEKVVNHHMFRSASSKAFGEFREVGVNRWVDDHDLRRNRK